MKDRLADVWAGPRLVLDGAGGTELERRGVRAPLPLWSAAAIDAAPDVLRAIHADYVAAGADVLVANTFRVSAHTLSRAGYAPDGPRLAAAAVRLARAAAATTDRPVLVAASLGPVEDCYHPERVPAAAALTRAHASTATWLAAAQPDLVWIETLGTVREVRAAVDAVAETGAPLAVSFITGPDGDLLGGERLEAAVAAGGGRARALGVNCVPPRGVNAALTRLRRATTGRVAVYAHIGNATPLPGRTIADTATPGEYAAWARRWRDAGADIIGGCCGTTPEHIRAVADGCA